MELLGWGILGIPLETGDCAVSVEDGLVVCEDV